MSGPHRTALLIVFTRYPVPGKVKTRLIPALGKAGAAEVHRTLAEKTAFAAGKSASATGAEVLIHHDGGEQKQMRRWLGPGFLFSPQGAGDLGRRMQAAFQDAFHKGYRKVLLFGTDIPELSALHLTEALDALEYRDVVLGPSTDGGYWLMGLKKDADLFQGIPWGTEDVLGDTLRAARQSGLSTRLLSPLSDVDRVEDLRKVKPLHISAGPYISVIVPALNEAYSIESTLRSARDEDAEIVVVDGGSTDGTAEKAAACGVRILKGPRGRAVQQNHGAMSARGRVILFLHADTRLPEKYVAHVFETLMDRRVVLGAFGFKTDLRRPFMDFIQLTTHFRSRTLHLPYGDQALFLRREVFEGAGGFPEVPIAEDLSLVRRLSSRGRIAIAPADCITSGRRWADRGPFRTSLMNQVVLAGLTLGISRQTLARLYKGKHEAT